MLMYVTKCIFTIKIDMLCLNNDKTVERNWKGKEKMRERKREIATVCRFLELLLLILNNKCDIK